MSTRRLAFLTSFAMAFTASSSASATEHAAALKPETRHFEFVYEFEVPAVAPGKGPVHVFAPIASDDALQKIVSLKIDGSDQKFIAAGKQEKEATYGNTFWHASAPDTNGKPITVRMTYEVERTSRPVRPSEKKAGSELSPTEARELALYLKPNKLVPVVGPVIDKILKDLPLKGKSPLERTRIIYDYVVDNMEYKKVGAGWGNGDTYWACSKKYGNCTDFHALFTSLARAEKIPSRFEIGFPVPRDRDEGDIAGYHCWVMAFVPGAGWFPIDASEAKKNPERRDVFFGGQPADRIKLSVGRDLELGAGHTTGSLNYFVYPHIEINGKRVANVEQKFHYRVEPAKRGSH